MGKRREKIDKTRSQTLPSSPSHSFSSSSSSDFEFTISLSPRAKSSQCSTLCPADELFYKGQLLPLHLSPRLSMVRTLLLASSSTSSSSDTSATASRDSTGSSNDSTSSFASDLVLLPPDCCDSSRPSSVTEDLDDELKRLNTTNHIKKSTNKYFSLSRFSSVFKKENTKQAASAAAPPPPSSVRKMSTTAREVIRKYLKKVKPLYEKLSQKQQQQQKMAGVGGGGTGAAPSLASATSVPASFSVKPSERSMKEAVEKMNTARKESSSSSNQVGGFSHSFSGNLRYPRRRSCVSSCPSSMRSSPSHSGVLSRNGFPTMGTNTGRVGSSSNGTIGMHYSNSSSMEELQSAIQGAIAHCKNSLLQTKTTLVVSNEI